MMAKIRLVDIAYARGGDKGDINNIGLMAKTKKDYELIKKKVTPQRIKNFFGDMVKGPVKIYPMDNIESLEIIMYKANGGGATQSVRIDGTGKPLSQALLYMEIEAD
jgi:hypothetical protein